MKRSLLALTLMVTAAQSFAQSVSIPVSVPEPSTLSLLAAGMIALGFARRRVEKQA